MSRIISLSQSTILPESVKKSALLNVCSACLGLTLAAPLWADDCDQLPKPSVMVKRLDEKILYNREYSYRSLTNIGASATHPGRQILGLTRGNATISFSTSLPAYQERSGRWECSSPQITMTYGISPITVYIAKEFPEGSCAYKEILEHEMRHVKTYQTHTAEIEKRLLESLNARFATDAPWRGPAGATRARLQQELDERWLPYVQREFKRVDEAQALIDTPEEYERVANTCDGEIKKRVR